MEASEYQGFCKLTAVFPKDTALSYLTLGLCGEAGEVAEKVKKIIRDDGGKLTLEAESRIAHELGDVMWYAAMLADELGYTLDDIFQLNYQKLRDRQERGKLHGSGDNR